MAQRTEGRPPNVEAARTYADELRRRGAPPGLSAEAATSAVLCTLAQRISAREAEKLLQRLPPELRDLARCEVHATDTATPFGRAELLQAVAEHAGCLPAQAEPLVRAVFGALQRHLEGGEIEAVGQLLPSDVEELWRHPEAVLDETSRAAAPAASDTSTDAAEQAFADAIRRVLPEPARADDAASAVLCTLSVLLATRRTAAQHIVAETPLRLRRLFRICPVHHGAPRAPFDAAEFVRRVAEHLSVSTGEAEVVARTVLGAARRLLGPEEAADLAAQLPPDVRAMWNEDPPPSEPQR